MTLSRSSPIPSHDWSDPDSRGRKVCTDCGSYWETAEYETPPPWSCRRDPLERAGPINKVSPDRDRKRAGRGLDTELKAWILGQACPLSSHPDHRCRGDVIAHHVRHKNHAGDWVRLPDGRVVGNLVSLCSAAHEEIHSQGRETTEAKYGIDLKELAREYGEMAPVEARE